MLKKTSLIPYILVLLIGFLLTITGLKIYERHQRSKNVVPTKVYKVPKNVEKTDDTNVEITHSQDTDKIDNENVLNNDAEHSGNDMRSSKQSDVTRPESTTANSQPQVPVSAPQSKSAESKSVNQKPDIKNRPNVPMIPSIPGMADIKGSPSGFTYNPATTSKSNVQQIIKMMESQVNDNPSLQPVLDSLRSVLADIEKSENAK